MYFEDGETFKLSSDTATMKQEIERFEGKEGFTRYLLWLNEAHQHYEISVDEVLHKDFSSILDLTRWSFLKNVVRLHPFESIWARASRYFWSERLRRVFTFGSMYMGMSPFDAPGTYSLLQYTELAEGIWYPRGGFHAVVEALVNIGKRLGVDYRLGCAVSRVLVGPGNKVKGVRLENGETLSADIVVVNADLVYAYNNLFESTDTSADTPETHSLNSTRPLQTPYAKSLTQREGSCSSISFYWSLAQTVPALTTHNIFLASAYKESFDSIFKLQNIPDDPSFYVNVPSRIDRSAAPPDCDSVVILVPIGHLKYSRINAGSEITDGVVQEDATSGEGLDINNPSHLKQLISQTRQKIINTIKARTGTDLSTLITHEIINDPVSWESTFNLDKGSILGLSHSFFNVLAFRPSISHTESPGAFGLLPGIAAKKGIDGVYFVGASTHPGTGVPIVLAGAKMTTLRVLNDLGMTVPWTQKGWERRVKDKGVESRTGIDNLGTKPVLCVENFGWLLILLAMLVSIQFYRF